MLSTESVLLSKDPVYHYLGINDSQRKTAVLCAIEGYRKSYNEVFGELRSDEKRSKKYFQCWSEIFYLIEEGLLFQDKHIEEVSKIINDTCGLNNTEESEDLINFDEYLKRCYSKLEDAYRGYNFEKDPKENQIKERLRYLEDNIFLDEDFEDLDDDKGGSEFIFNDIEDDEDEYEDDNEEDEEDEEDEEENDDEEEKDTKQIVAASPAITPKQTSKSKITVNDEKYDDLIISGFKKVSSDEELLKPKNAFDLITKGKNKQITYYKNKWNDSMWKRDHELKKKIKHEIVRIEEQTITLLSYNEKLNTLIQSGKSTGFWGFGGSKEVNDVKSRMKTIKERISEYKDKLMEALDDLDSCEEKIQEYSDELYELTNLKKYTEFKRLEGKGMSVARQLAKCKIDPSNLKTIFEL